MLKYQWVRVCLFFLSAASSGVVFLSPGVEAADTEIQQELKELRQSLQDLQKTTQAQNELIEKQQARIAQLEQRIGVSRREFPEPAFPGPTGARAPATVQPAPKGLGIPGQIGAILPEIGLVGDIVATSSEEAADAEGNDRIAAREIELVVGSNVDPYSRFDATFAFSDFEASAVEEAYLTRWGLPWDLKARFGRFFPKVGKQAAIHRDQLSTVDEPLVIRRYLGAEGFSRSGADVSGIFEGPWGWVLEPSVGILEGSVGEGGTLFGSTRKRPTFYSHLKKFKELSDSSSIELGGTYLVGSSDADSTFEVNALGLDATVLHHVTPVNPLKLQGEFFLQQRDEAFAINTDTGVTTQFDRHPWGAYALLDYRFLPQWSAGVRADHVRLVDSIHHDDQGLSAFLTFHQSEFARWRLQFRHEERGAEKTDDAVYLQGTFAIGTHKHQLQ